MLHVSHRIGVYIFFKKNILEYIQNSQPIMVYFKKGKRSFNNILFIYIKNYYNYII